MLQRGGVSANPVGHGPSRHLVDIGDIDGRPFGGHLHAVRLAQAGTATRHKRYFTIQTSHVTASSN